MLSMVMFGMAGSLIGLAECKKPASLLEAGFELLHPRWAEG